MQLKSIFAPLLISLHVVTAAAAETPSMPKIGDMREAAEALFMQTEHADGVWEINDQAALHHILSGLTCSSTRDLITLIDIDVFVENGLSVRCGYTMDDSITQISFFARKHDGENIEEELNETISAISEHAELNVVDGPLTISTNKAAELNPVAAKMTLINPQGNPGNMSIWINTVNGWVVTVRATYPTELQVAHESELLAAITWLKGANEILSHQPN